MLTGTIGARLRVPFTILARSSFGVWFSYYSVISLIVLSMFWFSIQTYIGPECVYQVRRLLLSHLLPRTQLLSTQMLKTIWPSIAHLPNHLPANAGITTSGMFQPPFTVTTTFTCPQECFAILSIGPFSSLSCSSRPRNYDFSSWQNQS